MKSFDEDFAKSKSRFNLVFRLALGIIVVGLIATVLSIVLMGTIAFKSVDEIEKVGLKATIERIWCGPNAKCL